MPGRAQGKEVVVTGDDVWASRFSTRQRVGRGRGRGLTPQGETADAGAREGPGEVESEG